MWKVSREDLDFQRQVLEGLGLNQLIALTGCPALFHLPPKISIEENNRKRVANAITLSNANKSLIECVHMKLHQIGFIMTNTLFLALLLQRP